MIVTFKDITGKEFEVDLDVCVLEQRIETMLGIFDKSFYLQFPIYRVCSSNNLIIVITKEVYIELSNKMKDGKLYIHA